MISRCYKTQKKVTYEFLPQREKNRKFSTSFGKISVFQLTDKVDQDENKRLKDAVEAARKLLKKQSSDAEIQSSGTQDQKQPNAEIASLEAQSELESTSKVKGPLKTSESLTDSSIQKLENDVISDSSVKQITPTLTDFIRDVKEDEQKQKQQSFDKAFNEFMKENEIGTFKRKRKANDAIAVADVIEEIVLKVDKGNSVGRKRAKRQN